jgi:hypothetical protein
MPGCIIATFDGHLRKPWVAAGGWNKDLTSTQLGMDGVNRCDKYTIRSARKVDYCEECLILTGR